MLDPTTASEKLICCLVLLLAGCTAPEVRLDQEAQSLKFNRGLVQGTEFKHVVYFNTTQNRNDELHVYLDGDGTPWISKHWISENPTPRNPLVLRLMSLDNTPSVYLGRPCYHGFSKTPPCLPRLWTHERYSKTVINSMAAALERILEQRNSRKMVLIGYSGGGALAMLLARHSKHIQGLITVAGNLDTEAWSQLHDYSPLGGSINPAQQPPLDPAIFQWHYAGGKDRNVPVSLVRTAVKRQQSAELIVIPDFDHACCWEKIWPSALKKIQLRTYPESPVIKEH